MAGAPPKTSVRMSPDECWTMLEGSINGTLTTLKQDGWPIALPVWFVVLDRRIYVSTRGKKVARIQNDERSANHALQRRASSLSRALRRGRR